MLKVFLLAAALAFAQGAQASSIERFANFISHTDSGKSLFDQKVFDRNGKLVQESRGTFAFQRPGRFRWAYEKPYSQLIVGDGKHVWLYDQDLRQVTVRPVDKALTSTPAALLAGDNDALRSFKVTDVGEKDGLQWLEAIPRDREGGFERIRIGFGEQGPQAMELSDSFGQRTVLTLSGFQRNPKLDPGMFRFTPPKGADVIGDTH
ncbi:MAG: outer membrane lipoprotein chaperone LolA [Xanthomonadaceae bacterium]|nr:outer membrane lipoprotein chaperone LolA [Xanthomonadaceae bacterium]